MCKKYMTLWKKNQKKWPTTAKKLQTSCETKWRKSCEKSEEKVKS